MLVHCFLLDENMAWQTSPTDLSDPKHRLASSLEKIVHGKWHHCVIIFIGRSAKKYKVWNVETVKRNS
jgi:hypothetical protein